VRLFNNIKQTHEKFGKNKKVALKPLGEYVTEQMQSNRSMHGKRCKATWNPLVLYHFKETEKLLINDIIYMSLP